MMFTDWSSEGECKQMWAKLQLSLITQSSAVAMIADKSILYSLSSMS